MNNQRRKNKIDKIKWSPISHDTCFIKLLFEHAGQTRALRQANLIQVEIMPLAPVVDPEGNVFNPATAIVFFNN